MSTFFHILNSDIQVYFTNQHVRTFEIKFRKSSWIWILQDVRLGDYGEAYLSILRDKQINTVNKIAKNNTYLIKRHFHVC